MASSSCANSPPAYASYDVLVHQLVVLRPASFEQNLAVLPLPFASSYRLLTTWFSTVFFLQRTSTSLVHAHAGRTQGKAVGRLSAAAVCGVKAPMKLSLIILFILFLAGCATPSQILKPIQVAAGECIFQDAKIVQVKSCLEKEGIEIRKLSYETTKDVRRYDKCRPSFYPLMTSCAWIHIEVSASGNVVSWEVGDGYDGP